MRTSSVRHLPCLCINMSFFLIVKINRNPENHEIMERIIFYLKGFGFVRRINLAADIVGMNMPL